MNKPQPTAPTSAPTAAPTAKTKQIQGTDSTDSKIGTCPCVRVCVCDNNNLVSVPSVLSESNINNKKTNTYKPTAAPTAKKRAVGFKNEGQSSDVIKYRVANGCNNPFIQAAALSFAHLKPFDYWSYQLRKTGDFKARMALADLIGAKVAALAAKPLKPVHLAAVVLVCIDECLYPITCRPWSGRTRAAACGMAQETWRRNGYCDYVDAITSAFDRAICAAESAISAQVLEVA